ncbi:helix-hairpin-helix domain-containing protein [Pseudarthrobacter sp. NPDC058329]|uniref:ComEA family DNA-binding protein n=1 Tax=Pseudarthrobacter sp. NPDC058329 TaxID=3346448 RepID=UPI0036DA631C
MTPEEKLCSRTWRLRNSAGVLWSILSFGFLTGVGFLIRGVKAKNKLWIQMGIGFLVLGVGLMVATGTYDSGTKEAPIRSTASTVWGWIWFLTFIGGLVAMFITNRKWLVWKAHAGDTKWYAQAGNSAPSVSTSPAAGYDPNAASAAFRSVGPPPPATLAQHAPPAQTVSDHSAQSSAIDVNAAATQDFVTALGIEHAVAERIVQARQSQGQFTSFEQLMAKAQIQPHLLIPHRHRLVFVNPSSGATQAPAQSQPTRRSANQAARRLDL